MLGPLTRYLRFMGYDTTSANGLAPGNRKEDTLLLGLAVQENRILLTGDAELARRGRERTVLVRAGDVADQVRQLAGLGLVNPRSEFNRCSLCNTLLREAAAAEIDGTPYAPAMQDGLSFFWCETCRKLYWNGSHSTRIAGTIEQIRENKPDRSKECSLPP
jgi:uncharacterized protein with PIN domain